ncbi:MAG TPA: hypothetical protein VIM86_05490 [Thermodesulfobacteriota bacterium]
MAFRVMVATFWFLVATALAGPARADDAALPQDLVEHARLHGCREVTDFEGREGVIGRPFVYGYVPGPAEQSAAYWCETGPRERPAFRLVLMIKDRRHELARCADHIEWGDRIGGLSIEVDDAATLDGFVPLDHRARRPAKGTRRRHPAIRSEHETAGAVFYCHEGVWFVRMAN